jgi:DNA topoisomerase-1
MSESKKYNLLILESPHKASVISGFLTGQNFKCISTKGHVLELPKKELGIDLITFDLTLIPIAGKEDAIKEIKRLAKEADQVYLASDPDVEGEAIAKQIQDLIKKKSSDVHRVLFQEITKSAIQKALSNPGKVDEKKYDAQKTRRVLDRLMGYCVSPLLWSKLGGEAKSAGRCQSLALRFIVDREDEIKNFIPEKFFQIVAKLKKDEIVFESKYFGEQLDKKTELTAINEDLAKKILEEIQNQNFIVRTIATKEKKQLASPPFTTSRLQQESSTKLKFNSKDTMSIAQRLYEGISLGDKGSQGLITYMRTDSVRTEPEALEKVREFIKNKYGPNYLPKDAVIHKKKKDAGNTQDAHESIRPTDLSNDPESVRDFLSLEEFKLYQLIWNKFIASQMNPVILDQTVAMLESNKHFFRSVGSVIRFDGYKAVYIEGDDKKEDGEDGALPQLNIGDTLTPIEPPKLFEKFTTPKPRYTESTLIKSLEDEGIGRPSTYSAIITNITDRNYVKKVEGKFVPFDVGTNLCKFLIKHFPQEMEYSFTAKFEDKMDLIADGNLVWTDVLKEFWTGLSLSIDKVNKEVPNIEKAPRTIDPKSLTGIKCSKCQTGDMIILKSKTGSEFLGCSQYPTCSHTENFKINKKGEILIVEKKETYHKNPCSLCNSPMVLRAGQYGKYFSCKNYPNCKGTRPVTLDVICPECKTGEFVKKNGKDSSFFYGCSAYPNCRNTMNFEPVNQICLSCQYPVLGKRKVEGIQELVCPKCKAKAPE